MSAAELEGRMMANMHAMVLDKPRMPLVMRERSVPAPAAGEILVAVSACSGTDS
jgi:D-arabinose 1-dehydrogenase-like Zn-dependent alcohol dehydrogenase